MRRHLGIRTAIVLAAIVASLIALYPPPRVREALYGPPVGLARAAGILPRTLNLGLDLQGGTHLVLGVDLDKAIEAQVDRTGDNIRAALEKKGIGGSRIERRGVSELVVQRPSAQAWKDAQAVFGDFPTFDVKEPDQTAGRLVLALKPGEMSALKSLAVGQALETIRNRVDEFGVAEPTIQQQGENRILVQLPGVEDPERAKQRIGRTALLEFRLVDDRFDPQQAAPPPGTELLYQRSVDPRTKEERRFPILVQKRAALTGADLADARVSIDQNTGETFVSVQFSPEGTRTFAELTRAQVGKRLAIVLDGNVRSAPQIREPIPSGRAQITGGFTQEEASDLAKVLRAGALPAPVQVLEERSVGPSLGADSIRQGLVAILASAAVIFLFMVVYYRLSGLIADIALVLNLLILLACMAAFGATLTLPGIAGIALTIGMAVDTNVLIFERIREELKAGKTARAAIDAGFSRAFTTIIDTHVTVLVTAAILYNFGTGPVKGFAVSLFIGLTASLFTAVFFTRLLFDVIYMGRAKSPQAISI